MREARRREFLGSGLASLGFRGLDLTGPEAACLVRSCLWRRSRGAGLERFELCRSGDGWLLRGTIVVMGDDGPAEAFHQVVCDGDWRTVRAEVSLRGATGERRLSISVDGGLWHANGREEESLRGCVDLDLGWSPSTNTLPIRRLELPVGGSSGPLRMAWIGFPELRVEPLPQEYLRVSERVYRYTSRAGAFSADLEVDDQGLVVDYQGVWQRVEGIGDSTTPFEPFLDALRAQGPPASRAGQMSLYDRLLGSWEVSVIDYAAGGPPRTSTGEWHFGWVLEGRAIQDVWISPPRKARFPGMPTQGNRYGTTLRVYHPEADSWRVTWINPVSGVTNTLVGRAQGDEIVQEGTDTDGSLIRWTFTDLTRDAFRWRGQESSDGGSTRRLAAEFFGRRIHPAAGGRHDRQKAAPAASDNA